MSKNILLFFVDSRGYFHIRISWLVSQKKIVLLVLSLISNIRYLKRKTHTLSSWHREEEARKGTKVAGKKGGKIGGR